MTLTTGPRALLTTLTAAAVFGTVGAVAGYRALGADAAPVPASSTTTDDATPAADVTTPATPSPTVRWAGCHDGAHLEHGVCVTEEVRTVVVPPAATRSSDDAVAHDANDDRGGQRADGVSDDPATHDANDDHGGRDATRHSDDDSDDSADDSDDSAESGDDHGDDHGSDDAGEDAGDDHGGDDDGGDDD